MKYNLTLAESGSTRSNMIETRKYPKEPKKTQ